MTKDISIPEYYIQQRKIAETYDISDSHAGCYITHYPSSRVCARCNHAFKCEEIFEKELKADI